MIHNNFAKKNGKNNRTRRKLVATPSYHVQSLSTTKKCNKNSKKAPQTPNKPPTNHLGRKVHRSWKFPKSVFLAPEAQYFFKFKKKTWWIVTCPRHTFITRVETVSRTHPYVLKVFFWINYAIDFRFLKWNFFFIMWVFEYLDWCFFNFLQKYRWILILLRYR